MNECVCQLCRLISVLLVCSVLPLAGTGCARLPVNATVGRAVSFGQPPLFVLRHIVTALRNEPQYTPEVVAAQMKVMFPDDIRDYAVLSIPLSCCGYYRFPTNDTPLELCRRFDRLGYGYFIEIADPVNVKPPYQGRKPLAPAEIRAIFENTSNCLGVETGESFWGYSGGDNPMLSKWLLDVLRVCADHKKHFVLGEGTWHLGHWSKFFKDHYSELAGQGLGKYLVPEYKATKPWAAYQNYGAIYGAWVTGLVGNHGMWSDSFVWMYSSFGNPGEMKPYVDVKKQANHRLMPYTFFLRQWLLGISQGASYSVAEATLAHGREGGVNDNFRRYLHPFIKGIGDHHITPSRDAVLRKTRAIINPYGTYRTAAGSYEYDPDTLFLTYLDDPVPFKPRSYDPFTVLYRNTYGFSPEYDTFQAAGKMFAKEPALPDRLTRDTLPNSSRYYGIPIMPMKDSSVPEGMKVLDLAGLRSDKAVQDAFNAIYPAEPAGTTAYAVEVDNSFFVINSSENIDRDQHYNMPLGSAPDSVIKEMSGDIGFQNILFGKREDADNFWFQANGYVGNGRTEGQLYVCPPKRTVITFACSARPVITPEKGVGGELTVVQAWTTERKSVTVSCDHAGGAVNFRISAR